jgi:hypothetical protein
MKNNEDGFGGLELLIVSFVVIVLAAIAFAIFKQDDTKGTTVESGSTQTSAKTNDLASPVVWTFNEKSGKYDHSGNAPECLNPIFSRSPVDTTKAQAVLYPGQYRGGNYKPHGGLSFAAKEAEVVMPMDGSITGLVRYIEADEVQYKLSFTSPCGVVFYFDHLFTLAPQFQEIAETTPEPKVDDTRAMPLSKPIPFKIGDVIATEVGHPKTANYGMDFGVLDLREPNSISRNSTWSEIHDTFRSSEWFGICWFDELPSADAARVKALPARDQKSGVRSDYCANPTGTTLDVNGGKPV